MPTPLKTLIANLNLVLENVTELDTRLKDPQTCRLVRHSCNHLEDAVLMLQILDDLQPLLNEPDAAILESRHPQDLYPSFKIPNLTGPRARVLGARNRERSNYRYGRMRRWGSE